jgi:DNA repair protein RadC
MQAKSKTAAMLKRAELPVEMILSEMRQLHDQLNKRLYEVKSERPVVNSPRDAYNILMPSLENLDHEELWVVSMNTRNRVLYVKKLYEGSMNSSMVRIGEIFRQAIIENAAAIIVAHNHPSGDPQPSPDDTAITRAIVQAGKLLSIDVLDHLVIGTGRFKSMKEAGLGFSY